MGEQEIAWTRGEAEYNGYVALAQFYTVGVGRTCFLVHGR